jgi:hypothetical protein
VQAAPSGARRSDQAQTDLEAAAQMQRAKARLLDTVHQGDNTLEIQAGGSQV